MQILIVEDDSAIAENLYDFLEACGHRCDFAANLREARARLADAAIDALILDRNLPDGDGVSLARELRAAGQNVPILMLTAREALDDKLEGFGAGVDDYLVKPFALKEVEARLLALSRRRLPDASGGPLCFGPLSFDPQTGSLLLDGQRLAVPPKALRLGAVLLGQPARLFSRRELEIAVWGEVQDSSDNLRSLLLTLRKALGSHSGIEIRNAHGLGYQLVRH